MTIIAGSRLGPYEILSPLGAGGMGEVWRARDPRLGREIAIKVLPASFSADADRLRRFEQEARAAGILNHPNITAVYDIGTHDGAPYVVQELLEGETLRTAVSGGRLSPRRAIDYALQIAHGLAAAHEKGIVHRDLKPENVFVTKDARVKILDFGLAKLTHMEEGSQATNLPTAIAGTEPGVVLGTLGYMSPEQVRGRPADVRSDIFSFGAILYEMLSGRRAFQGDTAADTMSAILREDPPDLSATNQNVSPGLDRVVRHCLEKNPEQRFHSAHDIAFALETLSGISAPVGALPGRALPRDRSRVLPLVIGAVLLTAAGIAAGFLARDATRRQNPPSFKRLTFRRGTVWTARFAPDGQTVVYSAAWENNPIEVYFTRPESPESRSLGLKNASLFGVSSSGELAVMLEARTTAHGYERFGTLARVPLAGGSPRPLLEDVRYADWTSDGRGLMVARQVGNKQRIEFPPGKVLYETPNRINTPRLSPRGDSIAFFESLSPGRDAEHAIRIIDLAGKPRTLTVMGDWWNLAWSADGKEVWYAAPEPGAPASTASLQAVTLSGKRRLLHRFPGLLEFHDVSRDGRVLLARVGLRAEVIGLAPGESKERELTWLDRTVPVALSPDGKTLLITEGGEGGGANASIYLRRTGGSPATLIGEGGGFSLSPDGRWVLSSTQTDPGQLVLLPTGAGTARRLSFEGIRRPSGGLFFPDGKRLLLLDNPEGKPSQLFVAPLEGGRPRALTGSGFTLPAFGNPISPDGREVVALDPEGRPFLCPAEGGTPKPLANLEPRELPIQWSADGRFLYTHRVGELPAKVWRYEIATGRKELIKELSPADPAGVTAIENILITPDARSYVYRYDHNLSDLYIVDGLK